ncbi:uncharacterized protein EV420DRAFT_660246 [Desarmillaria tabescens]|uniref:Uncharacterized protein n=1 Tax=Armillaria tabescens TaxID=1929756 RepID=A0AA39NJV8_ARMTA|nr:uncharacterized protein EV420DRAFT_660246 [Desarmillaria tabescens]KAK0467017.1 hypothetical protein EV420DRAFT_660246 [Desarmillaria tabescens]
MATYETSFAEGLANSAFVITGHPGIGKTLFIYYLLILRLLDGLPTALQIGYTNSFIFFDASGVYIIMHHLSTSSLQRYIPKGTWALVDDVVSLPGEEENIFSLYGSPFFVVHACSAQPRYFDYAKKKRASSTYYMLPFSWREIILCRQLLRQPVVPTENTISRWYDDFGPSAQACYSQSQNPDSFLTHRIEITSMVGQFDWDSTVACLQNYTTHYPSSKYLYESDSQQLFLLIPHYRHPFTPAMVFISGYILNLFCAHHKYQFEQDRQTIFMLIYQHPHSRGYLSHMFENEAKLLLQKCVPCKVYPMEAGHVGAENCTFEASEAIRRTVVPFSILLSTPIIYFYKTLEDISLDRLGWYLPENSDGSTLDSFIVSKDVDGSTVLSYQQSTVGVRHGVHTETLKKAITWLGTGMISKFRYIAIVPRIKNQRTVFCFPPEVLQHVDVTMGVIFIDPQEMS